MLTIQVFEKDDHFLLKFEIERTNGKSEISHVVDKCGDKDSDIKAVEWSIHEVLIGEYETIPTPEGNN